MSDTKAPATVGISPKAVLAAVLPTLGGVIAIAVQWAVTGELDRAEFATALGAVAAALLAFLGAYAGQPGAVTQPAQPVVTSSSGAGSVTFGNEFPAGSVPAEGGQ